MTKPSPKLVPVASYTRRAPVRKAGIDNAIHTALAAEVAELRIASDIEAELSRVLPAANDEYRDICPLTGGFPV